MEIRTVGRKRAHQNWINTNEAIGIVIALGFHCTPTSLRTWVDKYRLGKKIAGRWYIEEKRLRNFLEGRVDGN